MSSNYHIEKKKSYLRKTFLQLILLKVCERFLSDRVKSFVVYFGLCELSLYFLGREDQRDTAYGKKI